MKKLIATLIVLLILSGMAYAEPKPFLHIHASVLCLTAGTIGLVKASEQPERGNDTLQIASAVNLLAGMYFFYLYASEKKSMSLSVSNQGEPIVRYSYKFYRKVFER